MIDLSAYRRTLAVDEVRSTATGLTARAGAERLEIDAVRPDVVRIRLSRGGRFDAPPTHAVVAEPEPVAVEVAVHPGRATVATDELTVTLQRDPFVLTVARSDGTVVLRTATDPDDGSSWAYATLNDSWVSRRDLGPGQVYGLGERTGGSDRRGRRVITWNTDVLDPHRTAEFTAGYPPHDPRSDRTSTAFDPYYVGIPLWYHRDPATGATGACFLDNAYRSAVDLTGQGCDLELAVDGGQWCEYVFAGPSIEQVLGAYTWLTGRAGLPPMWALGHHQCRWHPYRQQDVLALADAMRAHEVPLDALWLDIDHMRGYRVFTWHPERFPDPVGLADGLRARGTRLVTIVDPGVKAEPGWELYDEALGRDLLCRTEGGDVFIGHVWPGDTAFPDFATADARRWWGELNAAHVAGGVAGIWNDMNEPATGAIAPDRMRFDHGRAAHERFHNQYALLMAMATADGLLAAQPDRRPFVLTRAGFAGIQRYAASWTGDNIASWEFLAQSIPMSTGLGLSGQPFVGSDIGGFAGEPGAELYTRWMQYGMLTPFARNHAMAGQADRYPWAFGEDVLAVVRDAIRLRYRLLPYLYSAFVEAAETGAPVQRPLVMADQQDGGLATVDDAYLLGGHLLVAPALAPGTTEREVRLPRGTWYDWHTGEPHAGGRSVVVPAPADRAPLLVRAGAVVPTWPDVPASTDGYHPEQMVLTLAVPDGGTTTVSTLQEDDGVSTAAQAGGFVRTRFTVSREGDRITVSAAVRGDGYPEHRRTAFRLVLLGGRATGVTLDGHAVGHDGDGWLLVTGTAGFEAQVALATAGP